MQNEWKEVDFCGIVNKNVVKEWNGVVDSVMKILLIEDDEKICNEFREVIKNREDIVLTKVTNSSKDALMSIKFFKYDGIIVDLELHHGIGSGYEFLKELQKMNIQPKPIVIVNTNVISDLVYDNIHSGLADMIFYKKQEDYSTELVINTMISLGKNNKNEEIVNFKVEKGQIIKELTNQELNKVGLSYKMKGREYAFEAISFLLENLEKDNSGFSIFQYLAGKYNIGTSSISRAIQTAINDAWKTTAIEDLRDNYTAKINVHTGVPTPTEFIYYYVEKIKKIIENLYS